MPLSLLDHLVTSLNSSTILGLYTIKRDFLLIKDQWRSFDIDIPKVGLTTSSLLSFYHFINGFAGSIMNISFYT